jgi:4-hydroxymandelate oxidase
VQPSDASRLDADETVARRRLPPHVSEYVTATAGDPRAYGVDEWDDIRIRPRVFGGGVPADLATTVLGTRVSSPILVAPMAQQVAAHPDGEEETARAVRARGSLLGVSINTAIPFERVQRVGAPWWFQVYPLAERELTRAVVERAAAAGAAALVLTVDTTALAVTAPEVEPTAWPIGPASVRLANLTEAERALLGTRPSVPATRDDIAWLREISGGLPVVVKGVLHPDDARIAAEAGASAVIVSTHGGRRSALSISSAEALPPVAAALEGTAVEVYADSGIRTGDHVLAALTLGARAVFVGRPVWWALAAGGAPAVEARLAALESELALAARQAGIPSLQDAALARRGPMS